MRRSYLRWAQVGLVWTVSVLMFLDTASACRFRRRNRDCCQPVACASDAKDFGSSGAGAGAGSGSDSGFGGAGAGAAPPPPLPAVEKPAEEKPVEKPAEEKPAAEKPAEPAPEKPSAEPAPEKPAAKPAAAPKTDDLDDLFKDAPKNPPKPAKEPVPEKPGPSKLPDDKQPAPTTEKPAAEEKPPAEEKPAAEAPAEKSAEEARPEEVKPAPKKPAPKVDDDDPFKISAEGQLATRSWTDDTGSFQIQGRLIALLDGKVRILKDTGKTTTVTRDRLSAADRKYVNEVAARYGSGPIGQIAAR